MRITLGSIGLLYVAYGLMHAAGAVSHPPSILEAIAGALASLGAWAWAWASERRPPRFVALAALMSMIWLAGSAGARLYGVATDDAPGSHALAALALAVTAVLAGRVLKLRLVTRPYDPPGPGPLAPAG